MAVMFASAIDIFANVLNFFILVRVIISWLPVRRSNSLIQLVYAVTEPILAPIRNIMYKSPLGGQGMMLDFSPIIAGFFIMAARSVLISVVFNVL